MRKFTEKYLACSFCHKSQEATRKLISSPSGNSPHVYICDEWITVCVAIMEDDRDEAAGPAATGLPHSLAGRLIKAVELWIRRESSGEDAAEELSEVRSIASQMLRE